MNVRKKTLNFCNKVDPQWERFSRGPKWRK